MRKFISALLLISATCARPAAAQNTRPFYLTKPAAQARDDTSATEAVVVYFDERTVLWLNAALLNNRRDFQEGGACLHIAKTMPPDGFWVDSVAAAQPVRGDTTTRTWRQVVFSCPRNWAPLHWHVVTSASDVWLREQGLEGYIGAQCIVRGKDVDPEWVKFPFSAMQCGIGLDSIMTYRVKKR